MIRRSWHVPSAELEIREAVLPSPRRILRPVIGSQVWPPAPFRLLDPSVITESPPAISRPAGGPRAALMPRRPLYVSPNSVQMMYIPLKGKLGVWQRLSSLLLEEK